MGTVGKIIGIFIAVVILALAGVFFYLNVIAKSVIERSATQAAGVKTSVDSVQLGLFSGRFGLGDLTINNPEGYESPHFFLMKDGRLSVGLPSLLEDTVRVQEISLQGIEVNLERKGMKSNITAILDNLKRFESGKKTEPAEQGEAKKFLIDELSIKDVVAQVDLGPELGEKGKRSVSIPEIKLQDIGSGQGGVVLAQLTDIVLKAITEAIVRQGGILPEQLRNELQAGLNSLQEVPGQVLEEVRTKGEEAAQELREKAGEEAQKLLEKEKLDKFRDLGR